MKILALDSSGLVASVAIAQDDNVIAEYTINYKKTHSQTLLPMIDEIVKMTDTDLESIDAIAVAGGPGSFTGLRIGSATAKGLGMALDKPLINIPTIEGLAYNMYGVDKLICPMMDAKRNQVYTGVYKFNGNELITIKEQMAVDIKEVMEILNSLGTEVIFLGDAVPVYKNIIENEMKTGFIFAPAHLNRQRAGAVAMLAMEYAKVGKFETATEHMPQYLRMSQAERERLEKENNKNNA